MPPTLKEFIQGILLSACLSICAIVFITLFNTSNVFGMMHGRVLILSIWIHGVNEKCGSVVECLTSLETEGPQVGASPRCVLEQEH